MAWRNGKIENSHFLLFEASGDSEVADSNNIGDHTELANSNNILGDTEGYDAESCSCEYPSDDHMLDSHEFNDCDHEHDDDDKDFGDSTDHEDEYCDDCKPRLTDRMMGLSRGPFAATAMEGEEEEEVESRFCVNGSVDMLVRDDIDEMEKNRLFWETCLQVGYP